MSDSDDNANNLPDGQMENGHISVDSQFNFSRERHSGTNQASDQFDIDLPTSHRYLGKLDNVTGYTFYDDGEVATLAAIQTNTLVFPGFTLPLVLNNDLEINMLQRHTSKKNAFVLLTPDKTFKGFFTYGVIMEIFETHLRNSVLYLKARSRQRCRLVPGKEIKTLIGDLYQVTVEVMLEPPPTSPLCNTQLNSLKIRKLFNCTEYREFYKYRKFRLFHLSQFPLASWVYDKHEICFLHHKLVNALSNYYLIEFIPDDPVQLSYWFVQNFQLRHEERLRIMVLRTAVERLRLELKYLNMKRLICCAKCDAEIAQHSNVFPMSKDGVQSNYCNPEGYVFETVTVSKATNFTLFGSPSAQFSWFPGYSWTIMHCKMCSSHLGWKFSSVNLKPAVFYGLAKSGFDIKIVKEESEVL
ncbi:protein cereblon [Tribolium castaneum]|uniref:Protein cereblon n=1 Tax=Tribolium castaneum TaxID=7070 RepID=D6WYU5_TRICA|nr:PREDICTED: protein cereblon [Tribolium castaneum]EFA08465.1 Protein cereblon homolog-like Protein [Tribolium castaneum]|eukprot:XP_970608.1 PREDICTED: protein cereblon [Tribolium castaneum]